MKRDLVIDETISIFMLCISYTFSEVIIKQKKTGFDGRKIENLDKPGRDLAAEGKVIFLHSRENPFGVHV